MAAKKDEKKDKVDEVITAVFRVNLHCRKCACDIKKPLLRIQGVHSVEVDVEKSEVKVKGKIEVVKIHKQIQKFSKKKVELISPKIDVQKTVVTEKKVIEIKKEITYMTVFKVHLHCSKCEKELERKLLKHKGVHSIKTDFKAQSITVEGTMESTKILTYLKKKVHKHAEIVSTKSDEKEEKKKEVEKKEKEKTEIKSSTEIVVEFKEKTKVEAKNTDGSIPYFVHYVYAPQLFSDENPNACSIV